jgi:hypothetical protein
MLVRVQAGSPVKSGPHYKRQAKVRATKHQYHSIFIYSITSISNCLNIEVSASVTSILIVVEC